MEAPVWQALLAIGGSVLILLWPILVMLTRAIIEARRWATRRAARVWISAWFAGSGIWVVASWIVVIIGIRLVTSTFFASSDSVDILSWVLILTAMIVMVPFAAQRPKMYGSTPDDQ